jgi:peptide/nickel transport system permease protein
MVSLVVIFLLILMAIFAPFIARYDPIAQPRGAGLRALYFQPPSAEHWLGTDDLGRDVFSRLIYGSRVSLLVGFLAAFSSVLVGTDHGRDRGLLLRSAAALLRRPLRARARRLAPPVRALAGRVVVALYGALYFAGASPGRSPAARAGRTGRRVEHQRLLSAHRPGRWRRGDRGRRRLARRHVARFQLDLDIVISRLIDFMLTLPGLPILLVLSAILRDPRSGIGNWMYDTFGTASSVVIIIMILVLFGWITTARLVRAAFLSLREQEFTMAAQALGTGNAGIMFKHLVPNAMAPIIVEGTLQVGIAILVEAALSFLGFGIQPPVSTWGNMLTNAQTYIFYAPWLAFPPGVMIVITVLRSTSSATACATRSTRTGSTEPFTAPSRNRPATRAPRCLC